MLLYYEFYNLGGEKLLGSQGLYGQELPSSEMYCIVPLYSMYDLCRTEYLWIVYYDVVSS